MHDPGLDKLIILKSPVTTKSLLGDHPAPTPGRVSGCSESSVAASVCSWTLSFLFMMVLIVLSPLHFHISFGVGLSIFSKEPGGIFLGMVLSLWVNLENTVIVMKCLTSFFDVSLLTAMKPYPFLFPLCPTSGRVLRNPKFFLL